MRRLFREIIEYTIAFAFWALVACGVAGFAYSVGGCGAAIGGKDFETTWRRVNGEVQYQHDGQWYDKGSGPRADATPVKKGQAPESGGTFGGTLGTFRQTGIVVAILGLPVLIARLAFQIPTKGIGTMMMLGGGLVALSMDLALAHQWILYLAIPAAIVLFLIEAVGIDWIKTTVADALEALREWRSQ